MDLSVELEQSTDLGLMIGRFEDLEYLVNLLNGVWESVEYRLEQIKDKAGHYLFIQDDRAKDNAEVGVVERRGDNVFAFTPAVHSLVMDAYGRYVDEFGEPTE